MRRTHLKLRQSGCQLSGRAVPSLSLPLQIPPLRLQAHPEVLRGRLALDCCSLQLCLAGMQLHQLLFLPRNHLLRQMTWMRADAQQTLIRKLCI